MAKALMILGTGSGAGKTLIAAALCRIFRDAGVRVAPFKGQNMALNSYITIDGGEIGRAQALQAEAAGIIPTVEMNPLLLKASGEAGSQVILKGKVYAQMKAREYYRFKRKAWEVVKEAYDGLSQKYQLIIMEGAGSPAEINLKECDVVNMPAAKYAKAQVFLVGDIDKGGVFASLYGTVKLLGRDARYIRGFIINKFRGDLKILAPGLTMIKDLTRKPVVGVLPYLHDVGLPEEDGLSLQRRASAEGIHRSSGTVKVVIIRLKYISNFTDFDPLALEPDVELTYSESPADIENADMVIIPGSKNTVKDLLLLREAGLEKSIRRAFDRGVQVMGMCGGYQMLGRKIFDPYGVESSQKEVDGIGLLNIETVFRKEKTTCRVEACLNGGFPFAEKDAAPFDRLRGYEIHMGTSDGDTGLFTVKKLSGDGANPMRDSVSDGSMNKNSWGTYLHGIFENDAFRRGIVNLLRERKGMPPLPSAVSYSEIKERALDRLAEVVSENLDMKFIRGIAGL